MRFAVGQAQQHEAASAQIAGVGVDDSQREASRDCRIHGVAACLQHLQTRIAGVVMNADHHGVLRLGRRNIRRRTGLSRGQRRRENQQESKRTLGQFFLRSRRDSYL